MNRAALAAVWPRWDDPATVDALESCGWDFDASGPFCPGFYCEGFAVYVLATDPALREPDDAERVNRFSLFGPSDAGDPSDEWLGDFATLETALRVAMAHAYAFECTGYLEPRQMGAVAASKAAPSQFCDDNEITADAYKHVFGPMFSPTGGLTPATLERCNSALALASMLLDGRPVSPEDSALMVNAQDGHGLAHACEPAVARQWLADFKIVWGGVL